MKKEKQERITVENRAIAVAKKQAIADEKAAKNRSLNKKGVQRLILLKSKKVAIKVAIKKVIRVNVTVLSFHVTQSYALAQLAQAV